uniref:Uncharacterized protein n=1 Tax=Ananas comosus var. bracteatus TaxID=296719 RepID=A0A6V7QPQ6_ANACO|nr:unnamed protein product [Ananas comosus var. bracteatus]
MHQTPYTGRPTPSSATAPCAIPEIRSYQVMVQPLAVDSNMLGSSLFCAQNDLAAGLAWPESSSAMGTSGQPRSVSTSNWCYNTQPLTATQFGDQDLALVIPHINLMIWRACLTITREHQQLENPSFTNLISLRTISWMAG